MCLNTIKHFPQKQFRLFFFYACKAWDTTVAFSDHFYINDITSCFCYRIHTLLATYYNSKYTKLEIYMHQYFHQFEFEKQIISGKGMGTISDTFRVTTNYFYSL